MNKYVEAEILNHSKLRHPHVIQFKAGDRLRPWDASMPASMCHERMHNTHTSAALHGCKVPARSLLRCMGMLNAHGWAHGRGPMATGTLMTRRQLMIMREGSLPN